MVHPCRSARPDADHPALLLERAAGAGADGRRRQQGLLLPLPQHGDRPSASDDRAIERRHDDPADGHPVRRPIFRPRRRRRTRNPSARSGDLRACRLELLPLRRPPADLDGLAPGERPRFGATGSATTRGCSSTSWRSARRFIRCRRTAGTIGPRAYPSFWRGEGPTRRVAFAPLFGHQYSHLFIDFRGIYDAPMRAAGFDYFENSRRATYGNRAYCIANPMKWNGYSDQIWGLTACDGPGNFELPFKGETREPSTAIPRAAPLASPMAETMERLRPPQRSRPSPSLRRSSSRRLKPCSPITVSEIYDRYGFRDKFFSRSSPHARSEPVGQHEN